MAKKITFSVEEQSSILYALRMMADDYIEASLSSLESHDIEHGESWRKEAEKFTALGDKFGEWMRAGEA